MPGASPLSRWGTERSTGSPSPITRSGPRAAARVARSRGFLYTRKHASRLRKVPAHPMATPDARAPKGTADMLPATARVWERLLATAQEIFSRYGYEPVYTPIFEHTDVFVRGIGEATDIVGKEMYTFLDKGGRSLTLRPEGTAPIVRAALEHGLTANGQSAKVYYAGPMFRYERPQAGRMRQFWQIGLEALGMAE